MNKLRIIISGGGTGGHIFPAIAIANEIRDKYPEAEILFVGAKGRMEMEKVPAAGYKIEGLEVAGFNRKNLFKNFAVLWKLRKSLHRAKQIIRNFKPDVVVGFGGYASGPILKIASKQYIPTLLHEANSYAGLTNKLLAAKATKICVCYEHMDKFFPKEKIVFTGNPVRKNLLNPDLSKHEALSFFGLQADKPTLLIIGGSLGAGTINQSVLDFIEQLPDNLQLIWQCGKNYFDNFTAQLANKQYHKKNVYINAFINRMDMAYCAADLVVSRAGATSIAELCLLGKPAILVPSPNVAEDHQTKNAMALVEKNAAVLITDAAAKTDLMPKTLELINDKNTLAELHANISKLGKKDAVEEILHVIETIVKDPKTK